MRYLKTYRLPLFFLIIGCVSFLTRTEALAAKSEGTLLMDVDDGKVIDPPYHPVSPGKPVTPENPDFPNSEGPLSINYVSNLSFSHQQATGKDSLYNSELDRFQLSGEIEEVPNYIQISDHRGSNSGWQLEVKQSTPFKNGEHILKGTELYLQDIAIANIEGNKDTSPTYAQERITLDSTSDYVVLVEAKKDQGMGTWLIRFGQNNEEAPTGVQLFVPGNSPKVKGHYKTTLSWLLVDTPSK